MRILVVGGSGLVGSHILSVAKERKHDVLGTYRHFPVEGLVKLDLGDEKATEELLRQFRPDWVVHSAGWTWVDGCESDPIRAFRENCDQPVALARVCGELAISFAYFSTTYIFDGTSGPYSESDKPNPINVYAKSKWEAEQRIQQVLKGQALIPRVICVWGKEHQRKNFVYQVIRALVENRPMTIPSDQRGNPSWAGDIAWWLLLLMERRQVSVWNLAGSSESFTRESWFCEIRDAIRASLLVPNVPYPGYKAVPTSELQQVAPRPLHAGAVITKIMNFERQFTRPPSSLSPILTEIQGSFAQLLHH
jgi:dTDP-4-dehydrorhamnose reductase